MATLVLIGYAWHRVMHPVASGMAPAPVAGIPASAVGPATDAGSYAKKFTPLVASMPWSAPAYQDLKPTDFPVLYCMISEEKGCRCYTQQITRYYIDEKICRVIVRDGVQSVCQSEKG